MARKYEIWEIREMRAALNLIVPARESHLERVTEIEEQLRTYMANGTSSKELEAEARRVIAVGG